MPLRNLLNREFGVETFPRINPLVSQVGTTPVKILDNNPNRLAWTFFNLSSVPISIGFSREVSSTNGMYMSARGGGVNFLWNEEFDLVGYALWALAVAPNSEIFIIEILEMLTIE